MFFMHYIFLDTETSGLTAKDRICQLAIVVSQNGTIQTSVDLCNPGVPIHPAAQNIHGISANELIFAPTIDETDTFALLTKLNTKDSILVIHNAPFDLKMLSKEGFIPHGRVIDTLVIMRRLGRFNSNSLSDLSWRLPLAKDKYPSLPYQAHDALGDACTLFLLFQWMQENNIPLTFSY